MIQSSLILYKTVNITKLKVLKFQGHRLSSLSAIKNFVTGVKRKWGELVLFLSIFPSVHISFQYLLNFHKSILIKTVNLFSSIALFIFCHLQVHSFFLSFFFIYLLNMNRWVLSLAVPCFVFKFNSRKSKQTPIVFDP